MGNITIKAEWPKIWRQNGDTKGYIEKTVNQTILGNCLYFNQRNLEDYSKGKTKDDQKSNYLLLQSFSNTIREQLRSETFSGLKITVRLFEDSERKRLIMKNDCAFSRANRAYTISWDNSMKIALQKMFPVSTALAISCGGKMEIDDTSWLIERIGITPFVEESESGLDLFPLRKVDIHDDSLSKENKLMLKVLADYSSNLYLNTAKEKSPHPQQRHPNAFLVSTVWRDAKDFKQGLTAQVNCIYTLASDPDENGVRKIYVGEAKVSGNRLKLFKTSTGKLCIDHTKEEAEIHQFTRFRLDQLKEDALPFLHDAQDSIIGTLWMVARECPNGFIMLNDPNGGLCASISNASKADLLNRQENG